MNSTDTLSFEDQIKELIQEIGAETPDTKKTSGLAEQAQTNQKKFNESINKLQELLDYLRVCIKYQVFDLEAMRRENEVLRKLLEENA